MCYDSWKAIKDMTDAELETFIRDADNEQTNVTQATFARSAQQYYHGY